MNRFFYFSMIICFAIQANALSLIKIPQTGIEAVDKLTVQDSIAVRHSRSVAFWTANNSVGQTAPIAPQHLVRISTQMSRFSGEVDILMDLGSSSSSNCQKLLMSRSVIDGKDSVILHLEKPLRMQSFAVRSYSTLNGVNEARSSDMILNLRSQDIARCERIASESIPFKGGVALRVYGQKQLETIGMTQFARSIVKYVFSGSGYVIPAHYEVEINEKNLMCMNALRDSVKNKHQLVYLKFKKAQAHIPLKIREDMLESCKVILNPLENFEAGSPGPVSDTHLPPAQPVAQPVKVEPAQPVSQCIALKQIPIENSPTRLISEMAPGSGCGEVRPAIRQRLAPQIANSSISKDYITIYKSDQADKLPIIKIYYIWGSSQVAAAEVFRAADSTWVKFQSGDKYLPVVSNEPFFGVRIAIPTEYFLLAGIKGSAGLYYSVYAPAAGIQ